MSFFVSGSPGEIEGLVEAGVDIGTVKVPPDMRKLLDELADIEGISERLKSEILQDEDARKTLFMLGLERNLKKLVGAAEKALLALTERDALATLVRQEQREKEKGRGRNSLPRRPTAFAFDQLDQKRHDAAATYLTHTVRAHSEPRTNGPRPPVEGIPRTGSETSVRGPKGHEHRFFLSSAVSRVSGRSMGRDRSASSSSSLSDVDVSDSSSVGPSGG
uniref:Pyochelin biosynthesis protein PchD n=1 Tax=Ganoderma boninense TaxID=34458 RepID=A0A5K1JVN6_9APHY|nr:Pyochelin biosynthesis protein PchD [Ganoderma boninense]